MLCYCILKFIRHDIYTSVTGVHSVNCSKKENDQKRPKEPKVGNQGKCVIEQ